MTKQYHAIPIIVYVPVEQYPLNQQALEAIHKNFPHDTDMSVFFAEDFKDGLVEIDHTFDEFSAMISVDCDAIAV
jgi:hypothetical protein